MLQFFLKSTDADVGRYLKLFTLKPLSEIETILETHEKDRGKRVAQHALAYDFVELVHGKEKADEAQSQHRAVFSRGAFNLPSSPARAPTGVTGAAAAEQPEDTQPNSHKAADIEAILPRSLVYDSRIPSLLLSAGMVNSRSEAQRLLTGKGVYFASKSATDSTATGELRFSPIPDDKSIRPQDMLVDDNVLVLRIGKAKVKIVRVMEDEEFKRLNIMIRGWKARPSGWTEEKGQTGGAEESF